MDTILIVFLLPVFLCFMNWKRLLGFGFGWIKMGQHFTIVSLVLDKQSVGWVP